MRPVSPGRGPTAPAARSRTSAPHHRPARPARRTGADRPLPGTVTLLVIAKEPVPGRVKTRLTPPYTPEQAARLAEASLADTLRTGLRIPARRRVLALAGRPGQWLPAGWEVVPQGTGGLDERIATALTGCSGPTLLLGMDTPQITPELLAPATAPGAGAPDAAWFGPARDGGFWALGLGEPDPELVRGVPMSTPDTGAAQRRRLVEAGLRVRDLPELEDMDTVAEADRIAARVAPDSRFAEAWGHTLPGASATGAPCADPGEVGGE